MSKVEQAVRELEKSDVWQAALRVLDAEWNAKVVELVEGGAGDPAATAYRLGVLQGLRIYAVSLPKLLRIKLDKPAAAEPVVRAPLVDGY